MQSHIARLPARLASLAVALAGTAALAAGVEVNPMFPGYGQSVDAQIQGLGIAPYIPATRYRRDGNGITIDFEHMRGGYFGFRSDMGYVPVSLGELAPGSYAIQARVSDIAHPEQAPWLFTQWVEVAPPDAPGIYPVPRNPGAYDELQVVVRADAPIDPSSLRATVTPRLLRVDFDYSLDASKPSFATVRVPGLNPGAWRLEAHGRNPSVGMSALRYTGSVNVDNASTVVEFYNARLDHYFMTASREEAAILDAGQDFERTGERFKAWLHQADAPASAVPVCRFHASGPNSHYYTAQPAECQFLQALQQKQSADAAAKGEAFAGWRYEGTAFYAIPARSGSCPAGTRPVWLFYNDRAAQNDSNHRFTVSEAMRLAMRTGWDDVGLAFCSPS